MATIYYVYKKNKRTQFYSFIFLWDNAKFYVILNYVEIECTLI